MKVGLLTTWNTQGGVAEYSRTLVDGLLTRGDVELTVLGSRNHDEQALAEPEEYVRASFDVAASSGDGRDQLDVEPILALGLDVLHVQYLGGLYNLPRLNELLRRFEGLRVVTWHDNVAPDGLEWQRFDVAVTHREGVGPGAPEVIPHPVRSLPPVVRTFGTGRTREEVIRPICERNGWVFESLAQTPADATAKPWKAWQELHDWLRGADAIVLWYDDDPLAGSAGAARTAIATRRPVIVNDTNWFADLPQQSGAFYKVKDDPAALQATLREILRQDSMIERWSPKASADRHIALYHAALERRAAEPQPPPPRGARAALRQEREALRRRLAGLHRLRARLVFRRRSRQGGAEAGGDPPPAG